MGTNRRAFTLVELLVVMTIIVALAALLLAGVTAVHNAAVKAKVKGDIANMMTALTQYEHDFAAPPPGGTDPGDTGVLVDFGAGRIPADPKHPLAAELQLRAIAVAWTIQAGNRTVGPYYAAERVSLDRKTGQMVDAYGSPYRYLADGRRTTLDPATGQRLPGRVSAGPVLWSVGRDRMQDPLNNNLDDNGDGKADDPGELVDDICSWN